MSDWIVPKFSYWNGSAVVDFIPTYPATKKTPVGPVTATRHDLISSTGLKQSVTERIDNFQDLPFQTVPASDLSGWTAMMNVLLTGAQFDYYADSTSAPGTGFVPYTLEDLSWTPKWVAPGVYSFTIKLRQYVGSAQYYS